MDVREVRQNVPQSVFTCYPREFWKDNKKRVGEVCEKCRDEVDGDNVRRRNAKGCDAS